MDCNREEAMRAKQLAEKKMEVKDFSGALKIALKAQQLYPELENISQLILYTVPPRRKHTALIRTGMEFSKSSLLLMIY
ncbi:hypothetical protein M8C21_006106 [Ambrosia artemisiifolia]|uniref:Uncharacterized protein n=1 Tax=Ambrosia artemisiifolia TaxID=4212 RepID=A0AAD5G9L4_AMBAR|nr:hypothetical protein M8C21_006106 [Ambrosia artemisiifolia]